MMSVGLTSPDKASCPMVVMKPDFFQENCFFAAIGDRSEGVERVEGIIRDFMHTNDPPVPAKEFWRSNVVTLFFSNVLGHWVRGWVTKISEELKQAEVLLVDYGMHQIISMSQMRALPRKLLEIPMLAFSLQMVTEETMRTAPAKLDELLQPTLEEWLQNSMIESRFSHRLLTVNKTLVNELLNKVDSGKSCKDAYKNALKCAMKLQAVDADVTPGSTENVLLSWTNKVPSFYLRICSKLDSLSEFTKALGAENLSEIGTPVIGKDISVGMLFAASFEGCWYRVQILDLKASCANVFLIDYGEERSIQIKDLRVLPEPYVKFPMQAIRGVLYGVLCDPRKFKTSPQEYVLKKFPEALFKATFLSRNFDGSWCVDLVGIRNRESLVQVLCRDEIAFRATPRPVRKPLGGMLSEREISHLKRHLAETNNNNVSDRLKSSKKLPEARSHAMCKLNRVIPDEKNPIAKKLQLQKSTSMSNLSIKSTRKVVQKKAVKPDSNQENRTPSSANIPNSAKTSTEIKIKPVVLSKPANSAQFRRPNGLVKTAVNNSHASKIEKQAVRFVAPQREMSTADISTTKSLAKSDASVAAVLIPLCESGEKVITELFEDFGAEPNFATAFPCSTPAPSPVRMSIISRRESLENGGEEDRHFEVLSKSAFESSVGFNKMDEFDYLETGELQEQATFNFSAMMSEVLITKPTRTPATQNITNPYKTITISSISMHDCLVTSISSQDDFWVQLAENALELEELMLQISSSTTLVQMPLPKIGDPCLFMVTPGLVLRGLIVETDSSLSVSVVAVDFGCIQEVLPRHIFEIEEKFLEPPQFAVHCGIVQYPQNMDSIEWFGTYQMLFSEFFRDMNSGKYFVEHFQHWNEDDYYVQT